MTLQDIININIRLAQLRWQARKIETSDFQKSYDMLAFNYDSSWSSYLEPITGEILVNLSDIKPSRILDLGCGTGSTTLKLKKMFPDAFITGLDISRSMLKLAHRKLGTDKILLVRDSMERGITKFDDGQFDLVSASWCIGYLQNESLFGELGRVISDGGYLLILSNKANTLEELKDSMKYVMARYPQYIEKAPVYNFPKNSAQLLQKLGSSFKEVKSGEGNFKINLEDKDSIVDWLLKSGILAGYEYIINLRTNKECRNTMEIYLRENHKELVNNYMWLLVQKK